MGEEIPGSGGKVLFVCSSGGHLTELIRLSRRFGSDPESLWVTFDTLQSRHLLEGQRMAVLPYIGPRDLKGTIASAPALERILRREQFDAAISTGAAIATVALPMAAFHGIPSTYVESASRLRGPSLTGQILRRIPGVHLRTQNSQWADDHWRSHPSVLEDFRAETTAETPRIRRVFVALGTIEGYRFDSVIDAFLATGLANDDTVWQLGYTSRDDLPGTVHDFLQPEEFARQAREADLVITHTGVGTMVEMLTAGIFAVYAVRRASRNEHVDDHQVELADIVTEMGVGISVEGPDLTREICEQAARRRVVDTDLSPSPLWHVA
ncbi:UDP-N-acetylglucosamine transferase subunit ALG13 [Microbacterium sp. AG1240]|nr:UDP-N-acetylglucosamine transferase subunit ALG13 [Microbacterium sp. AG1240]